MSSSISVRAAALLVLLLGTASSLGEFEIDESSCNSTTYSAIRSAWSSENEPCHQKLSLDMWAFMKAQGSARDADAQHVYEECLRQPEMGLVEIITAEGWNSDSLSDAPGEIVDESEHAASFLCKGAEDFEAICKDEAAVKAARVVTTVSSKGRSPTDRRRLQLSTSEAGVAHQVDELVKGLEELGCLRTKGEDQTICVMSDSFNTQGLAAQLQGVGDLPPVDVVKDFPSITGATDEGSAMIEVAFDIASGANFKFNTGILGQETFADDIGVLAGPEGCDVIVDDVVYADTPSYRDGVVAKAVDAATQDHEILYFSSAGNDGHGYRFPSLFVCDTVAFSPLTIPPCTSGSAAHNFNPMTTSFIRFFFPFVSTSTDLLLVKWDDEEGTDRQVTMAVWQIVIEDRIPRLSLFGASTSAAGNTTAFMSAPGDNKLNLISLHLTGGTSLGPFEMQLLSWGNQFIGTIADAGAMYGHACAKNAISVAAIAHTRATGDGGAFADPETTPVDFFSSRGPCLVDDGQGLSTRNHPVTTAASDLQTTTPGDFNPFHGTSAAAPVAAAIAAIIRAACYPRVVTYTDMMEMLTDYDYTIDATADAGGAPETFGPEAGYGIISARKMCRWVAENCAASCPGTNAIVHGDPHLVGLAGQTFDFTGQSNSWYALLAAWGTDHVNMRVTAPMADLPGVTYITGISVQMEDEDGVGHSIVIFVRDPSVLDTSCPADGQPCIGDGALAVVLDGVTVVSPGKKDLGPGVSFAAANIPGECRPFGFERYWQQKVREAELFAAQEARRLSTVPTMDRWIAEDPSATNQTECEEYVSNAVEHDSLFTHQSDHVSFQLITPKLTLRLNHGKLHQRPERDPTDTFDIPEHTTFQMNLGFLGIKRDDTMQGIIGETTVPTIDDNGANIMSGLEAIRGQEDDYKVDGPLGKAFKQLTTGTCRRPLGPTAPTGPGCSWKENLAVGSDVGRPTKIAALCSALSPRSFVVLQNRNNSLAMCIEHSSRRLYSSLNERHREHHRFTGLLRQAAFFVELNSTYGAFDRVVTNIELYIGVPRAYGCIFAVIISLRDCNIYLVREEPTCQYCLAIHDRK